MSLKAASCHQCLELIKLTQQHFSPAPINLQGCSFPQDSFMENPAQCRLLSHLVTSDQGESNISLSVFFTSWHFLNSIFFNHLRHKLGTSLISFPKCFFSVHCGCSRTQ